MFCREVLRDSKSLDAWVSCGFELRLGSIESTAYENYIFPIALKNPLTLSMTPGAGSLPGSSGARMKNGFDSSSFHARAASFRPVASIFFKSGMFTGLRSQIAAIKL